jgi:hypothetical protein
MTRWFGPILLFMGILCATCVWAQNDTGGQDTGAPTQPGPKPAYTYPDTTPSLDFLSQSVENSSLTLGIGAGFSYISYGYGSANPSQNRWLFHVTPSIKIQQFRPKLSWNFWYAPGYQTYTNQSGPRNSNSNLFSQLASAGFLWQLARRWQLMANDSFVYSANPFDSYLTSVGTPTMNNPNPVTYFPLTQYTTNNAILALTNQLTKVDTLTFTGTESLRRTSSYNLISTPFYDLVSYGGRASYTHQLSPRLTLGASYNYNSLDFGKGQQRSGVQTISLTMDYLIRPNMSISGWIGPEHTGTQTTIFGVKLPHASTWSTAVGANFGWQGLRNSFRAGFSRGVSNGLGLIGSAEVNSVNASYHRKFTPKIDLALGGRYFHDVSITTSRRSFGNLTFDAVLNYKLAKSLTASAQYAFVHQSQSNGFLVNNNYDANMVGVSINYTWNHPLGR